MARIVAPALLALAGFGISSEGLAQAAPSQFTSAARYDEMGRVTGTIAPDPDGTGPLAFAATRTTYDAAGRPIKQETGELANWQSESVAPSSWSGFNVLSYVETTFDAMGRKTLEINRGLDGRRTSATQYSYDAVGRLECVAQRMNVLLYTSLPYSACTHSTEGGQGPDRITKNIYDASGQLLKVQKAYGTPLQQDYATYTYTLNGRQATVKDANGNLANMTYDGHDRQVRWNYPSKTSPGTVSVTDYEEYGYDANGNRTSLRKRDGSVLTYQFDALNRNTVKVVPERAGLAATHTRDVYYGYDLRGLQTYARFDSASGEGLTTAYDGFGRQTSSTLLMDGITKTLAFQHDANGNRTQLQWVSDTGYTVYVYDGLNRLKTLFKSANGTNKLADFTYNNRGLPATQNGKYTQVTGYGYDRVGRLNLLSHDLTGTAEDVTFEFAHNPANQITNRITSNDTYVWTGGVNANRAYAVNGLNQYTSAGNTAFAYDDNGNLTQSGSESYVYDVENRLVSMAGAGNATLRYDPLGRLYQVTGLAGSTRFHYDGDELVAEHDDNGVARHRYVHGRGVDDPVIWHDDTTYQIKWLHADNQGSIVSISHGTGPGGGYSIATNRYDEWGIPGTATQPNTGRFQYTGQIWIPEIGLYYYKARLYSPSLGRFMQTDPIGYDDGLNIYAYVGNDPVNRTDPTGTEGIVDGVVDWGTMVVNDLKELGSDIASGDFQHAFGGMPPTLGGGVVSSGVTSIAGAATVLKAEVAAARAAPAATRGGENAATAAGRQAHRELAGKVAQKPGWKSEPRMTGADGKTYKPDVVTPRGRILELKPNTPSGQAAGARQTANYSNQLGAPARTITYQPPPPPPPPKRWWKIW